MKNWIKGTHHISLRAEGEKGFAETIRFYHEILGMPIVRSWGEPGRQGAMLDTGDAVMEINSNGDGLRAEGSIRHFALRTDVVDEVIEAVRSEGYRISMEPKDVVLPSDPPYEIRVAFCEGPCGESIEFFCER